MARTETTVFELAGEDKPGLLSETTRLLTANGCNVRSAAVRPSLAWRITGPLHVVMSCKGLTRLLTADRM